MYNMEKCNKCKYSLNHHTYNIFKCENGKIYLNQDGVLVNDSIHVNWDDLINYLKEIGKIKND